MALWTEEKSEVMDQKVKEYEEQKKRDEEMRAEIKRQQEERESLDWAAETVYVDALRNVAVTFGSKDLRYNLSMLMKEVL